MDPYGQHDDSAYSMQHSLMNQPPQMFDYGNESPNHYSSYYGDGDNGGFDDGMDGVNDNGDPKRRRIARACDMCRKKKIKCDGKMPSCSHCLNYKTECIFTQVEKKRNPPKGAKYIEGLENRLGRMESLLKLSGLLGDQDVSTDLGTLEKRLADQAAQSKEKEQMMRRESEISNGDSTSLKSPDKPESTGGKTSNDTEMVNTGSKSPSKPTTGDPKISEKREEVEMLSDMMCSLVTTNYGETRYLGSSSGFSIFSPRGIQWVNEKTGDASFQHMMIDRADDGKGTTYWKPEIFGDIFTRRIFRPLPPLSETLSLLKDYFENFNCMFPLFHEPTFMHLVRRQYSRDPYTGSGWWASLNCALAIAHRLRVMSNLVPQEEDQKAWGYLKNALGVMAELTMRNTDLLSVQALLGMALFLQGTPNPQPSFLLVASALRLAHSIGLHKRGSGFNLSPAEVEQRKRVFWIAYMLDKDMCLRSGRPPAQDDNDMNVELPSEDPADNIGNIPLADGKGKVNIFRLMCTFASIESKVYNQLYSTSAAKQSDGELLHTIGELDKELEEWKEGIPVDFRPEHDIKATHTPLILHVVVLHFAYYNCLTTIHRMAVHHGYWTSRLSDFAIQGLNARPLNPRVFSSAAICVQAARASIQLIRYIPQGDYACVWMIIYYPVSALVTIFANVLQNPQDVRSRADIRLMHQVVSFLAVLAVDEETGGVKRMLEVCQEFERIAKVVLEKSDKESHSRRKRKNKDDDEPAPRAAPERRTPQRGGTTPKSQPTPTPSTGLTPNLSSGGSDIGANQPAKSGASSQSPNPAPPAQHPFSSPLNSNILPPTSDPTMASPPAPDPAIAAAAAAAAATGITAESIIPGIGTGPGDWPNPYNDFGIINQLGAINNTMNMAGQLPPHFTGPDMWNMPMNFEWDWTDMQNGANVDPPANGNHGEGGDGGPYGSVTGPMAGVNAAEMQQAQQTRRR